MKPWMRLKFIFEGFTIFLMNFNYIILFSILTIITMCGIVTTGASLMALCTCMRKLANNEGVKVSSFFVAFKKNFVKSIPFSIVLLLGSSSLVCSITILSHSTDWFYLLSAYIGIGMILCVSYFLFYLPFAAYRNEGFRKMAKRSVAYSAMNITETFFAITCVFFVWQVFSISAILLLLLFLPTSAYFVNRMLIS